MLFYMLYYVISILEHPLSTELIETMWNGMPMHRGLVVKCALKVKITYGQN